MNNKILFLVILFIFIVLPFSKAGAAQVYVGVQVTKASAPGCTPGTSNCPGSSPTADTNWCLPVGSKMVIKKNESCYYFTNNYDPSGICQGDNNCYYQASAGHCISEPVTAEYPVCAGGNTMWSGLIDLQSSAQYKAYLYVPNFCPGYVNGFCFVANNIGQNCCSVCSNYGLTASGGETSCETSNSCYTDSYYDDANCTTESKLMGSSCSGGCTTGLTTYSYFNPTTKECFSAYNGAYYSSCSAAPAGVKRVCACNYPTNSGATGFLFNFSTGSL